MGPSFPIDKNPNRNALCRMIGSPYFAYMHRAPNKDGLYTRGFKTKETPNSSNPIGRECVFLGTQGVYTRVQVHSMHLFLKWPQCGIIIFYLDMFSPMSKKFSLQFENQSLSLKMRSVEGRFEPQVSWTQTLMYTNFKVRGPLMHTFNSTCPMWSLDQKCRVIQFASASN